MLPPFISQITQPQWRFKPCQLAKSNGIKKKGAIAIIQDIAAGLPSHAHMVGLCNHLSGAFSFAARLARPNSYFKGFNYKHTTTWVSLSCELKLRS